MQNIIVFFNNQFLPKSEVHISPDDRGFIFADGIYDVIRFYNGKLFHWNEHLKRIIYSLSELKIQYPAIHQLEQIGLELYAKNNYNSTQDIVIYIHITRGVYKRFHGFPPEQIEPTVYVTAYPVTPNYKGMQEGVKVVTTPDIRWGRCDIKSIALPANLLAKQYAIENNAYDAIFEKNGLITEGTHTSLFGIKNGKLITHPLGKGILPGITRGIITKLCNENNIPLDEREILVNELYQLDEIFLAGTTTEVMPVVQVNDSIISNGKPGLLTQKLQLAYKKVVSLY